MVIQAIATEERFEEYIALSLTSVVPTDQKRTVHF